MKTVFNYAIIGESANS